MLSNNEHDVSIEKIKSLYSHCQRLLAEQDYVEALKSINSLQQVLSETFASESFNQNIFLENSVVAKEQQALFLSIDNFFNQEIENLTLTVEEIKTELSTALFCKIIK